SGYPVQATGAPGAAEATDAAAEAPTARPARRRRGRRSDPRHPICPATCGSERRPILSPQPQNRPPHTRLLNEERRVGCEDPVLFAQPDHLILQLRALPMEADLLEQRADLSARPHRWDEVMLALPLRQRQR